MTDSLHNSDCAIHYGKFCDCYEGYRFMTGINEFGGCKDGSDLEADRIRRGNPDNRFGTTGDHRMPEQRPGPFQPEGPLNVPPGYVRPSPILADGRHQLGHGYGPQGFENERIEDVLGRALDAEKNKSKMLEDAAAVNPGAKSKAVTTNPKDLYGSVKVDISKVPAIGIAHEAMAMMDGADKYGPYNWRDKPVIASIYVAAGIRHFLDWNEGQELASDSHAHHLGHAKACAGILLDAQHRGVLIDDRPAHDDLFADALDEMSKTLKRRAFFKREGYDAFRTMTDKFSPVVPKCPYDETTAFEKNYWTRGFQQAKDEANAAKQY